MLLADNMSIMNYAAGQVIMAAGERGTWVGVLLSGA